MSPTRVSKTPYLLLAACVAAALAACSGGRTGGSEASPPKSSGGPTAVTINGEAVPQALLDAFASIRGMDLANPQQRERAMKQLTDLVLVDQLARKDGYASDPGFASMVELGRLQAVSAAAMRHLQKTEAIDDAAIRAEYDRQTAKGAGMAYDFSQMTYADEASARKAAAAIGAKPFDATLDSYRKDARSARNYTQVRAAQVTPAMAAALEALKPGETTKEPVQLPQGWTVLHVAAANEVPQPPFEQVKDGLRRTLAKRSVDEHMARLRESASVVQADPPPAPASVQESKGPTPVPPAPAAGQ